MKWKIDNQYKNIVLFGNFLVVSTIVDMQFNIDVKWLKSIIVKKIYFWLFIRKSKQTQNPKIGLFRSLKFIFKYHCNYCHNCNYHHWYHFVARSKFNEFQYKNWNLYQNAEWSSIFTNTSREVDQRFKSSRHRTI